MATLKEIAAQAGVSVAAASTALSGRAGTIGVSEATRRRVIEIADAVGYRPNRAAASLRTGRTGCIGLCLPHAAAYLSHPQGAQRFWKICELAAERGFQTNIIMPNVHCDARTMDGCLVLDAVAEQHEPLSKLARSIPVVSMVTDIPGSIRVHNDLSWRKCRRMAAKYLLELGHQQIAVVHTYDPSQRQIPELFRDIAKARDLDVKITAFQEESLDPHHLSVHALLANLQDTTAVFAIDDTHARVLISHLMNKGLRVPHDISVFSGSTSAVDDALWPRMTGLLLDEEQALTTLFNEFSAVIKGEQQASEIRLPPVGVRLVERESCAKPSGHSLQR